MYKGPVVGRACDGGLIFNFHIYAEMDYSTFSLTKRIISKKRKEKGDLGGSAG